MLEGVIVSDDGKHAVFHYLDNTQLSLYSGSGNVRSLVMVVMETPDEDIMTVDAELSCHYCLMFVSRCCCIANAA